MTDIAFQTPPQEGEDARVKGKNGLLTIHSGKEGYCFARLPVLIRSIARPMKSVLQMTRSSLKERSFRCGQDQTLVRGAWTVKEACTQ